MFSNKSKYNKVEKEFNKIKKQILKFANKYLDTSVNICYNLKCDTKNNSYNLGLYINPIKQDLQIMKENINLELKERNKNVC
jgi:hypothetical protein